MPKRYSSKQIQKVLGKLDFEVVGQKGSHLKFRDGRGTTTILKAKQKVIRQGTFLEILKQVGVSKQEFEKLVK